MSAEPDIMVPDKYGQFGEVSAERLMATGAESIPCLLEPVLQQVGIAAVVGSSDTGKSAFLRELAVAISAGKREFLGLPLRARYRRAVYISTEDDERAVSYLLTLQKPSSRSSGRQFRGARLSFRYGKSHPAPRQLIGLETRRSGCGRCVCRHLQRLDEREQPCAGFPARVQSDRSAARVLCVVPASHR